MPFGLMPGEDDWLQRIIGGGMGTPPFFPQPQSPAVPLPTPSAAPPERPGFLGKLDKATSQFGGTMPLGLALLANSRGGGGFGEIFGKSALMAQQMGQKSAEQDLERRYREAQIEAMKTRQQSPRRPIAVTGPDGKPVYVDEQEAIGKSPFFAGAGGETADMQNFKFWKSLTPEQQKEFLGLQRQPTVPQIVDINGVKNLVDRLNNTVTPLTTLDQEAEALRRIKEAEAQGAAFGKASGEIAGGILKKGTDAKAVTSILDNADALIDIATGSAAGAVRDKVAAWAGYAPTSAQAIGELKILQANLMLQQPRMEGPQGVLDVQLYEKMAGEIGDPTVPAAIKKANLRRIRQLQEKYVERAEGAGTPPQGDTPSAKRKRYNPATGKIE